MVQDPQQLALGAVVQVLFIKHNTIRMCHRIHNLGEGLALVVEAEDIIHLNSSSHQIIPHIRETLRDKKAAHRQIRITIRISWLHHFSYIEQRLERKLADTPEYHYHFIFFVRTCILEKNTTSLSFSGRTKKKNVLNDLDVNNNGKGELFEWIKIPPPPSPPQSNIHLPRPPPHRERERATHNTSDSESGAGDSGPDSTPITTTKKNFRNFDKKFPNIKMKDDPKLASEMRKEQVENIYLDLDPDNIDVNYF